eukprot:12927788-Prorocentrum_lima.AAC.1
MAAARFAAAGTPGSKDGDAQSWKQLKELPTLSIPAGEPWERNHSIMKWIREVKLSSILVSQDFSSFVSS